MATDRELERFRNQYVEDSSGCWVWIGSLRRGGYAGFSIKTDEGWRVVSAHRWSYETFVGRIPDGLVIDHLCRTRHCVRPDHMEPVTHRENTIRGIGPTAQNAHKTHCKRGHEFTPENVYISAKGRACRTCDLARQAIFREQRRRRAA